MRSFIGKAIGIILMLTAAVLFINSTTMNAAVKLKVYKNTQYEIQVGCPVGWIHTTCFTPTNIAEFSAPKDAKGSYTCIFGVGVLDAKKGVTVKDYCDSVATTLKSFVPKCKIVEKKKVDLAGQTGYKIVYTGTVKSVKAEYIKVFTIKNNKTYVISFSLKQNSFNKYGKYVESIIKSFRLNL